MAVGWIIQKKKIIKTDIFNQYTLNWIVQKVFKK